jgi:hypothetical protein
MATLKRPGVFLEERPPLTINPAGTVGTSTGALVGAATRGPVVPTVVTSYSGFARLFHDVSTVGASELSFQAYGFFANGGSRLWAWRVPGAGAAAATRTLTDRAGTPLATLVINAANPGSWGNNIYVDITDTPGSGAPATQFDLTVYLNGITTSYIVERFSGLTMDPTQPNYVLTVINNAQGGSAYINVAQPATPSVTAAPNNLPAVQAGRQLTNGLDGAAPVDADFGNAIQLLDNVSEAVNLGVPGATPAQQSLAISYGQNRGDVFTVCELPTTITTSAAAITAASGLTPSSYGAVYWPPVIAANPASTVSGATRIQNSTGAILGLIALTDATRGIQKAPAGLQARIAGALAPAVNLVSTDLDDLNVAQVNAIRQLPGSGVVVMGARTLQTGASTRYVPIRRSLIYVKSNVINLTQFAIFEPNTTQTRQRVQTVLDTFLASCWASGLLKGNSPSQAYYIVCDSTNNTTQSISQGVINVEVGVSLITPAEFIVIKVGQFEAGTTVTGG